LLVPEQHPSTDKSVPQIVDAWSRMITTGDPSQLGAQGPEDILNRADLHTPSVHNEEVIA
jgi:hypothetical protein